MDRYLNFMNEITEKLRETTIPGYCIQVHWLWRTDKNEEACLCLKKEGEENAPIIWLSELYALYENGTSMEQLIETVKASITRAYVAKYITAEQLSVFENIKDKIAYKLVNTEANMEMLKCIPSYQFMDLSLIFYLVLEENEYGSCTAQIKNEHLVTWGITKEYLYDCAKMNTPRLLPARINEIKNVIGELSQERTCLEEMCNDPLDEEVEMYVASNIYGHYGSAVILYHDILKEFVDKIDRDVYVLPSSVHEVLLVPVDDGVSADDFREMVKDINQTIVPAEDVLSDSVYRYDRDKDLLRFA